VGILDFNKAKIIWMQHQLTLDQLKNHIQNQQSKLQTLNGGKVLNVNQLQLPIPNQLLSAEVIWEEKLAKDPNFNEVLTDEATALQKVKLEKNKILPNLALGYNYQGIKGDNYAGVYGGLSIPIWNSKNKVKAAQANYEYQHYNVKRLKDLWQAEFQQGYNQYQLLFNNYTEYNATISQLNSEDLLFKAYTLGEFSFLEYFMEVRFSRNAVDKKVEIEQQIKLLQARLLNHRL
jgi:hypothetical protein